MILGKVVGRAWSDRQVPPLAGQRFLLVKHLTADTTTVAVDLLDVGVGVTVLVATDEAAAAASGVSAVDAAVVALVSEYEEGT